MTRYEESAARFTRDTAEHQMTVLYDDGLYRHIRFKAPDTGFYWFDLVTWPGRLAFVGDMDGYVFARTPDMFEFFRSNKYGINPDYWSEKVDGGRDRTKSYSEAKFRQLVAEHVSESEEEFPGLTEAVKAEILDNDLDDFTGFEQSAREVLEAFAFSPDAGTVSGLATVTAPKFRFTDTWEWDLRDYGLTFLWCCHAIRWGIGKYDAAPAAGAR